MTVATSPTPPPSPAKPSIAARRRQTLQPIITRLRHRLMPLHPLPRGPPHPAFPRTLLHYHILTETQLDSIASYYHQRPFTPTSILPPLAQRTAGAASRSFPSIWTSGYPAEMNWDEEFLKYIGEARGFEARTRIKRRKVGKFIGLQGCQTPALEKEERERWMQRRHRAALKGDEFAFWGRKGWWN